MKKVYIILGLLALIIFEFVRVYLIMPLPGSQQFNSIDIAYFLGTNKWFIRLVGYLFVIFLTVSIWMNIVKREKLFILFLATIYVGVFYMFSFKMEADKMFYQPTKVITASLLNNKIPSNKLVIGVVIDSVAIAYPIQLIGYHHQVVDTINNKAIMVTYCTVCRTGRVYSPIVKGKQETFRLVGMDHFNAMFEDQSTKSWWRQSNGECIAGPLKGYKLQEIKSEQAVLSAWSRVHPNTRILQPDPVFKEKFDQMNTYDKGASKGSLTKRDKTSWSNKSWVLGVEDAGNSKTYDWNQLVVQRIIQDSIPNNPIVILLENDTASFHTYSRKMNNDVLSFLKNKDSIWDTNTGSLWNYDGICIDGQLKGKVLTKVASYQEFLHSWEFFHPKSSRYGK
ncbi:MAG: DUF3179 domain-containing (seleno)protein [Chitinophagaceae bacterium]